MKQAKKKNYHDQQSQTCEHSVGQRVHACNFHGRPSCIIGAVVGRLGSLTYLVQVESGAFWGRHIDELNERSPHTVPVVPSTTKLTD